MKSPLTEEEIHLHNYVKRMAYIGQNLSGKSSTFVTVATIYFMYHICMYALQIQPITLYARLPAILTWRPVRIEFYFANLT